MPCFRASAETFLFIFPSLCTWGKAIPFQGCSVLLDRPLPPRTHSLAEGRHVPITKSPKLKIYVSPKLTNEGVISSVGGFVGKLESAINQNWALK